MKAEETLSPAAPSTDPAPPRSVGKGRGADVAAAGNRLSQVAYLLETTAS